MSARNHVIAVYENHDQAEQAVKELWRSGFDMKRLSIIGKGHEKDNQVTGCYTTGDGMQHWGKFEAFWGSLWGLLAGAAFLVIPGVGRVLIAGPLISAVAPAVEGAIVVGGMGVIGAGLYSLGMPRNSVLHYESAIKVHKFLLAAGGTTAEVIKAREILETTRATEINLHPTANMEAAVVA